MRGWIFLLLLALPALALEPGELAEKVRPSVALLTLKNGFGRKTGTGTGFFIAPDRMVTNYHVIRGGSSVVARLADKKEVVVNQVLACSESSDLAVLLVPGSPGVPLALGDSAGLKVGAPVAVVGSPLGLSAVFSRGEVSAIRDEGPDNDDAKESKVDTRAWRIQLTAPISPGSSGSPVVDGEGSVIAIAVGVIWGGDSLNFAVPVQLLKDLLAGDLRTQSLAAAAPSDSPLSRNLMISVVFFVVVAVLWRFRVQH